MCRVEVLHEDEGHPRVCGQSGYEFFSGLKPTRGGANRYDGEYGMVLKRTARRRRGWTGNWLHNCPSSHVTTFAPTPKVLLTMTFL